MSDLKLVPPDQPTPFEQRLLDAVANEAPTSEQRARVRLALGLPAVAPQPASRSPVARRVSLSKAGGGLVVISGAMLALFLAVGRKPGSVEQQPAVPVAAQTVLAVPAPAPAPAAAAEPVAAAVSAVPSIEAAPSAAPLIREAHSNSATAKRPSKAASADGSADLSEQLRLIDAARAAVAARNAAAASSALNDYRTRFPRGPFGQEASVLQIQTLDLQGNHAQAAVQARNFLARYPNSPHVSVVRRIADR